MTGGKLGRGLGLGVGDLLGPGVGPLLGCSLGLNVIIKRGSSLRRLSRSSRNNSSSVGLPLFKSRVEYEPSFDRKAFSDCTSRRTASFACLNTVSVIVSRREFDLTSTRIIWSSSLV